MGQVHLGLISEGLLTIAIDDLTSIERGFEAPPPFDPIAEGLLADHPYTVAHSAFINYASSVNLFRTREQGGRRRVYDGSDFEDVREVAGTRQAFALAAKRETSLAALFPDDGQLYLYRTALNILAHGHVLSVEALARLTDLRLSRKNYLIGSGKRALIRSLQSVAMEYVKYQASLVEQSDTME